MADERVEDPTGGRRPTPGRRGPDFLIIGATKSGTTSLYRALRRHPGVFLTDPKEPNYFSVERRWARGQEWYESLYEGAAEGQVTGEASSASTRWPISRHVPERIDALYPFARFVYIMRHPVERAFSHYSLNVQRKNLDLTFEEALAKNERYVVQGLYMSQIGKFLDHFSRDRFLYLLLDDLRADPAAVFERLQRFLDVPVLDLTQGGTTPANRGGDVPIASRRLARFLRATAAFPGLAAMARALPQGAKSRVFNRLRTSGLSRFVAMGRRIPPMLPETRAMLHATFREDTERLEAFLDRDLSAWKE